MNKEQNWKRNWKKKKNLISCLRLDLLEWFLNELKGILSSFYEIQWGFIAKAEEMNLNKYKRNPIIIYPVSSLSNIQTKMQIETIMKPNLTGSLSKTYPST